MKALILNPNIRYMGETWNGQQPKCIASLSQTQTIFSRQLTMLARAGVSEVVVTAPTKEHYSCLKQYHENYLKQYIESFTLPIDVKYWYIALYEKDTYTHFGSSALMYDAYQTHPEIANDDVILLHGDVVFEAEVLEQVMDSPTSCVVVSSTTASKGFRAEVDKDKFVTKIGLCPSSDNALCAQLMYQLKQKDFAAWIKQRGNLYENQDRWSFDAELEWDVETCPLTAIDVRDALCRMIDTDEELTVVRERVREVDNRTVYMCFGTDMLHSGHIAILRKAERLGKLIIGVLSDKAVASYRRFPMLPFDERKSIFDNLRGVHRVIEQPTLSYAEILRTLKPHYVVHGDDWREGFLKPIRDEVVSVLAEYGGKLIEHPYANDKKYEELEMHSRARLAMPDLRRARLKKLLAMKGCITAIEAHSGITGLIAEKTTVMQDGKTYQFDAMWSSSLCDSTSRGKPDIELVDLSSRFHTVDEIMEVTTKPIIFDGDTGGLIEHFVYTVKTLERMGVSMVIIEDKTGLKKNSLFGTEVEQTQDSIEHFSAKIRAGKQAQQTEDFMICARIESLILEQGMDDALARAFAYTKAGADAIMIHSRKKEPDEIFAFVEAFRAHDKVTPIVVVPTSFHSVTEEEFEARGINIVIYANQLTRSGFPAMVDAAKRILQNHRAQECDEVCMPFKEIINLIPQE